MYHVWLVGLGERTGVVYELGVVLVVVYGVSGRLVGIAHAVVSLQCLHGEGHVVDRIAVVVEVAVRGVLVEVECEWQHDGGVG